MYSVNKQTVIDYISEHSGKGKDIIIHDVDIRSVKLDGLQTYKLNEIIYITHFTDDLSFLHTLYNGKLNFYNKELVLEEYVDSIVDVLSNYFLDINKVLKVTNDIKRAYKLQKIMTNGQI